MRKTFILLVLFVGCLFGGTPNEDLVAAGQKCDIDGVKDAVARGADINKEYIMQQNLSGEIENYRTTVERHTYYIMDINCMKISKYLRSVEREQKKLLEEEKFWADKGWAKKRLNELTGIDKEFFDFLIVSGGRGMSNIKSFLKRGADINLVVDEHGGKLLMLFANGNRGSHKIMEVADYLSLQGADSYGVVDVATHFYEMPKIFEDKYIKIGVNSVSWGGKYRY